MEYQKFLENIENIKTLKEVLDYSNAELSDLDNLLLQHINAKLKDFTLRLKEKVK